MRTFILAVLIGIAQIAEAQTNATLKVVAATVYRENAELTCQSVVTLKKGENHLVLQNVAADIDEATITINAGPQARITSYNFRDYYLTPLSVSARVAGFTDSLKLAKKQQTTNNARLASINEQIAILTNNRKVTGEQTGLNVAELTKMLDVIDARLETLILKRETIDDANKELAETIKKLELQIAEEKKKGDTHTGEILVSLDAMVAGTYSINASYVIEDAGWDPIYDVVASQTDKPLKIIMKAEVYQSSGIDWDRVRLTFSSGTPKKGINAPYFSPKWLSFIAPKPDLKRLKETSNWSNELSIGGARKPGTLYIIDGVQVQNIGDEPGGIQMSQNTVDNASGINTLYEVTIPYSIPSDGDDRLVTMKEEEVPAIYRYYAAPALDPDAFLQASIPEWHKLNLISGDMNIFYDGAYAGSGYLNMEDTRDSLIVSLGRDKKVVVSRTMNTQKRSVRTIGTNVREDFGWTIAVRNLRSEPISLTLRDQLPLSADRGISLENEEIDGAYLYKQTGMLKWDLAIPSGQTKYVNLGYTVRYPKDQKVRGLR